MTHSQKYIEKIISNFEKWRQLQGKTQAEVAAELDVSRSHLNKVLNYKTNPSLQLIERMEKKCYGE